MQRRIKIAERIIQNTNANNINDIEMCETKVKKLTLLKAPHVYKAAREQFIVKSYKTLIVLKSEVDSSKLRLLILNKPKTVKIRIKR